MSLPKTTTDLQTQGWEKQKDGSYKRLAHAKADILLTDKYGKPTTLVSLEKPPKRIKQRTKPLVSKLEAEFWARLSVSGDHIESQAIRFELANGLRYTPDFVVFVTPLADEGLFIKAYEVKGPHAWDDSIAKLKMAAHAYPEIMWVLAWKQDGEWKEQIVLP